MYGRCTYPGKEQGFSTGTTGVDSYIAISHRYVDCTDSKLCLSVYDG